MSRGLRSTRPDRRRALGLEPAPLDDDQTGWLMTFSDLVLQLFAFVLVSVVLSGGGRPSAAVDPTPPSRPPVVIAAELPSCPRAEERREGTAAEQPSDAGRPRDAAAERLAAAGRSLEEFVAAEGRADAVQVAVRDSDLIVTLSDAISFASGSAELLPAAAPILHRIGALARAMPDFDLEVDGHTDDRPIHTGGFPGLYYHLPSVQHGPAGVVSFADGHVATHKWIDPVTTSLAREKWIPNHISLQFPNNRDLDWLKEHASVLK